MEPTELTSSTKENTSGLRGPRAPPSRHMPRSFSSISDLSRSHTHANAEDANPSGSTDADSEIEFDNLVLPRDFRDIRVRAAEHRRERAAGIAESASRPSSAAASAAAAAAAAAAATMEEQENTASFSENEPHAPGEDLEEDELEEEDATGIAETSSDPGSSRPASPPAVPNITLPSPRPHPPLRAPMALPAFLGARMSHLQPHSTASQRAATDRTSNMTTFTSDTSSHRRLESIPDGTDNIQQMLERQQLTNRSVPSHDSPARLSQRLTMPPGPAQQTHISSESAVSPASQRSRRRESQRRLSLLRGNRREPNTPLLAALSAHGNSGPGVLLPSLYGYFSNEPAPTQLRPAGVAYGPHGHGRVGVPWQDDTSLGATSSDGRGYVHPRLSERILASGPSVTNLHPSTSTLHMSPGSELRVQTSQLRNVHVRPGSMLFPAGITSSLCTAEKAKDAHMSRKFEENAALSFSWVIEDVALLNDEVKHGSNATSGGKKSEAWKLQPLFGEERWRLELVRRPKAQTPNTATPTKSRAAHAISRPYVLCLYLSYLGLMSMPIKAELPAHVMIGIRPAQRVHKLPRALDSGFLWRDFFSFTFQQDNDTVVFDRLPDLADVLADPDVAESNAMDLVIQVATGPSVLPESDVRDSEGQSRMRLPFEAPDTVNVPRGLLHALSALVDDGNSGDIMITVLEKGFEQQPTEELAESVGLKTFIQPWPTGTPLPELESDLYPAVFVRDRVLWAHSSILRERSEFFATMIESNFAEGALHETPPNGGRGRTRDAWRRPYRMLRIPGADFVTMYWFLRYLYTEEVELLREEDVQGVALDDYWILNQSQSSAWPDWKWRRIEHSDEWDDDIFPPMNEAAPPLLSEGHIPRSADDSTSATPRGDLRSRTSDKWPNMSDPHPHPPMLPVPPASALSLYRLSHRYGFQQLCDLTMTHVLSLLTPHNAIHYLLCTALLPEIQKAIQEYIVQNWNDVSSSPEFEYCCDQVSTGEWGPLAGRALLSLMRQLRHTSVSR